MFLPNPNEITPLREKYRQSYGFMYGEDERSVFKMAFDFSRNATLTTAAGRQIQKFLNVQDDVNQNILTPKQALDEYNVKMDEDKTEDNVRYLAQIQNMANYIGKQVSFKRNRQGSFKFWRGYMGGILAGAALDPVLLVSGGLTGSVVGGAAKLSRGAFVARTLFNSNKAIKYASRAIAFGGPEAGLNVLQGYNFTKQINQDYNHSDALVDGFLGLAMGTAISGLLLKGVDISSSPAPKLPSEGAKVVTNPDISGPTPKGPKTVPDEQIYDAYYNREGSELPNGDIKSPEIEAFLDEVLQYSSHNSEVASALINQAEGEVRELMRNSTVHGWPKDKINQEIAKIIDNMEGFIKSDKADLAQTTFEEELRLQSTFNPDADFSSQEAFDTLVDSTIVTDQADEFASLRNDPNIQIEENVTESFTSLKERVFFKSELLEEPRVRKGIEDLDDVSRPLTSLFNSSSLNKEEVVSKLENALESYSEAFGNTRNLEDSVLFKFQDKVKKLIKKAKQGKDLSKIKSEAKKLEKLIEEGAEEIKGELLAQHGDLINDTPDTPYSSVITKATVDNPLGVKK